MADAPLKDRCIDWAIGLARHGGAWWMPLLFLAVSAANALTGSVFIWCLGVVQGILFPVVVMSNGKFGLLLGPLILTIAAAIGAVTYMQLMKTGGADALLTKTGAKDSKWLATAQQLAQDWGVLGLLLMKVLPFPVPTAVIVVAAMLAKIDEFKILAVVLGGKFVQLVLAAVMMQYAVEGASLEEYLRMQFKGGDGAADEKKTD
mmetsp:Transcript_92820/g.284131  ORF Transcript_92820/g.284131 Transcript_92820/m.284131 type:complete len:204 (-) Transcript_92820:39-650(-)